MGSTGSGRFSDYSNSQQENGGGSSGTDRCEQAFTCSLEEVAQSEYFSSNSSVPNVQSTIRVIIDGRLMAIDENGVKIGALPTEYNYLAGCIESGFEYIGVITSSAEIPFPAITADFSPR